jgi:cytochrome c oxidase accessory protein FixG
MSLDLVPIWTVILALSVFMYVLLDGFDLGIGILFPLAPDDGSRDAMMASVAPVWDGNETWLIMGGIGLFTAFPVAFSIIFPALYFPVLAMLLAHTFLAYFVGTEALAQWLRRSPAEHPTSFLVMAGVSVAMFANFTYFREQTCLVACPYGRMQSVLLDRQSMIVAYDPTRGEPRMKGKVRPVGAGDCIDCGACVQTCPTGIDIRDGLQMECIHCTQCADACDDIMTRVGKPKGLIRYSSRELLEGHTRHLIRPRTVL